MINFIACLQLLTRLTTSNSNSQKLNESILDDEEGFNNEPKENFTQCLQITGQKSTRNMKKIIKNQAGG